MKEKIEKAEEKPVEKKEIKEAVIVDVTTQTAPAIQLEDGRIVDALEFQVIMYNDIQKIKKAVA